MVQFSLDARLPIRTITKGTALPRVYQRFTTPRILLHGRLLHDASPPSKRKARIQQLAIVSPHSTPLSTNSSQKASGAHL